MRGLSPIRTHRRFSPGLHDSGDVSGLIVAEKTRLTNEAFKAAQNLAVIEFSMTLHPVGDAQAAAALLISFAQGFAGKAVNPLSLLPQPAMSTDQSIMKGALAAEPGCLAIQPCFTLLILLICFPLLSHPALTTIPGLGSKNAKTLITKFGSLQNIAMASHSEIVQTVGETLANKIKDFLDS